MNIVTANTSYLVSQRLEVVAHGAKSAWTIFLVQADFATQAAVSNR